MVMGKCYMLNMGSNHNKGSTLRGKMNAGIILKDKRLSFQQLVLSTSTKTMIKVKSMWILRC